MAVIRRSREPEEIFSRRPPMTRVLLTGAGGFAGHHCLEHLLVNTDWTVICTDSFRHKGKTDRIAQVLDRRPDWSARVDVITHDLAAPFSQQAFLRMTCEIDYVLAYASESHVDRSIEDPMPFVRNNVNVALSTLELCRQLKPKALVWVSTDEVYGPELDRRPHAEWSPILPSNPYSASKAAQEALCISYWRTYGVPVILVNAMNMIGERQDPEKFVPKVLKKVLAGEIVTIHGHEADIGTRHYLHSRNLADGILFLLQKTEPARFPLHDRLDRYHIASPDRIDNLTLARMIAHAADCCLHYQLEDFHTTRPGHDPHYGLDTAKITSLGWKAPVEFRPSLVRTIHWTLEHPEWLVP